MNNDLNDRTSYLFDCNFFSDNFDPEGKEEHLNQAREVQGLYAWRDVINAWHNYLYKNCHTAEEVINFANLFYYYEGADEYNPAPYKFIGYLYAKVDMDKYWDQAGDLFDSIAIDILSNQQLIDIAENPYYTPLKDPKVLKEITKWQSSIS